MKSFISRKWENLLKQIRLIKCQLKVIIFKVWWNGTNLLSNCLNLTSRKQKSSISGSTCNIIVFVYLSVSLILECKLYHCTLKWHWEIWVFGAKSPSGEEALIIPHITVPPCIFGSLSLPRSNCPYPSPLSVVARTATIHFFPNLCLDEGFV